MDTTSRFWDKAADKYSRSKIADEAAYQKKLDITRELFRPDMDLLELGCGTGSTAILHAPHVRHITATDFSKAMLDIAEQRARDANVDNITFRQADINHFDADGRTYDMVLTLSVLHLLKRPDLAISRIYKMLKPGGYFVSSTACLGDNIFRALGWVAPLGRALGLLPQLRVLSDRELVSMIEEAGFTIRHHWHPGGHAAVFIVAQKGETGARSILPQ